MQPKLQMDILRDIAGRLIFRWCYTVVRQTRTRRLLISYARRRQNQYLQRYEIRLFQKVREILAKESWWDPNVIYPMRLTRRGKSFATK